MTVLLEGGDAVAIPDDERYFCFDGLFDAFGCDWGSLLEISHCCCSGACYFHVRDKYC